MPDVYIEKADTLHFNSNKDQSFKVTTVDKYKNNFEHFTAIGVLKSVVTRTDYMDIFDRVFLLSKKEQGIFQELKDNSDRDLRIASMPQWADIDKSDKGTLYQRLANLKKVGLIRKVTKMPIPEGMSDKALTARIVNLLNAPGNFTFIINPNLIKGFEVNSARAVWNQLS